MYSILTGRSRVQASELSRTGCVAPLSQLPADAFLPTSEDFVAVRSNLIVLVSRIITRYIDGLSGQFLSIFSISTPLKWVKSQK